MNENFYSVQIETMSYSEKLFLCALLCLPAVILASSFKPEYDYCIVSCKNGHRHFACELVGRFGEECGIDAAFIDVSVPMQNFILSQFNLYRNQVARGFNNMLPAARMATLTWNAELAFLANLNVRDCKEHTDKCRNTISLSNVGQTVAYHSSTKVWSTEYIIYNLIKKWFEDYRYVTIVDIVHYRDSPGTPKENFLQIALENANQVGCGLVKHFHNGWYQTFFTCNFANAPIVGKHIFSFANKPGQNCSEKNLLFSNLCDIEDQNLTNTTTPRASSRESIKTGTEARTPKNYPNETIPVVKDASSAEAELQQSIQLFGRLQEFINRAAKLAEQRQVVIKSSNHQLDFEPSPNHTRSEDISKKSH